MKAGKTEWGAWSQYVPLNFSENGGLMVCLTRHDLLQQSVSKYVTFQLAEVAVPRQLFAAILDRIGRLTIQPSGCPSG